MANTLREPPRGGGIAGSGHGTVTFVRRLPWSWRRPSTTARSGWRCREREWRASSTTRHGDRSLHSRGRGRRLFPRCPSRRLGQSRSVTVPLLSTPSLADTMADQVDDRAVQLLLKLALSKKESDVEREERRRQEEVAEHERRMRVLDRRVAADEQLTPEESYAWRAWAGHLPGGKRKRKKRRKRKLPKSSSSVCRRPCTLQRQVPAVHEVRVHGASDSVHRRRLDTFVVQQRQVRGFLVQKTVVVPQLQFFTGRQHPLLAANADPHGPVCPADHGDSTVAAYFGGRCSCCRVAQIPRCCRGEALGAPTVAARREICGSVFVFAFGGQEYGFSGR